MLGVEAEPFSEEGFGVCVFVVLDCALWKVGMGWGQGRMTDSDQKLPRMSPRAHELQLEMTVVLGLRGERRLAGYLGPYNLVLDEVREGRLFLVVSLEG